MTNLVARLRAEYGRTGAYAPSATCRHGVHPYDCREGCAPPGFEAADEIERLRAALKVAQQAIIEFSHAQGSGPNWYTHGEDGMYRQVHMWLRLGLKAVRDALGPYDDNGQYLKELPAVEPSCTCGSPNPFLHDKACPVSAVKSKV